jgi:hypothetical protein
MSKKNSHGLFTLFTGIALGAAAVFFSDKNNREKTKKSLDSAKSKYQNNPEKAIADAKKLANKKLKKLATLAQEKPAKKTKSSK